MDKEWDTPAGASPPERPDNFAGNGQGRRWINGQPLPGNLWLVEEGRGLKPKVFWPVLVRPAQKDDQSHVRDIGWSYVGWVTAAQGWRKPYLKVHVSFPHDITGYFETIEQAVHFLIFVGEHYYAKT